MKSSLHKIAGEDGVMVAKALDGDNRFEVYVTQAGFYSVFVENTAQGARSLVPTRSSLGTILLLKENMSAPAFAQITWSLLRWSAAKLRKELAPSSKRSA